MRNVPDDYHCYWTRCPDCQARIHPAEQPDCRCTEEEDMDEEIYIFTFGLGQAFPRHFVELRGSSNETRQEMFRLFGDKWSMQYPKGRGEAVIEEYGYEQLAINSELSTLKLEDC